MKKALKYVLTTAVAGFFTILPFAFILFILLKAFGAIRQLGDKFAEAKLEPGAVHPLLITILAVLFLFLLFFLTGALVAARTRSRGANWVEEKFLNYVPGYLLVKGVANGIMGMSSAQGIRPARLEYLPGVCELVLIMEELPDDWVTVFAPSTPNFGTGKVLIVRKELLQPLESSLMDLRESLSLFGMGMEKVWIKPEKGKS